MSEWKNIILTEASSKIGDGLHGTPYYDESGKYYFINGNNLSNGKILIKSDTKKISENEYKRIFKELNTSSILISINGTIGNIAKFDNEPVALGKSTCYINLKEDLLDKNFFYYHAISKSFQTYLNDTATGTTIPNVPLKAIREYDFKIPSLPEQQAIASVLSSLDDKIDFLNRQNKTLEAMAETLFRQWFIEEAKDDWELGQIGNFIQNNKENSKNESIKEDDKYVGLEHIDRKNIALKNYGFGNEVSSNKTKFLRGDILFGKLRPYFHKVCITSFEGICSTDILVLRAKNKNWQTYSLFTMFQKNVVEFASLASGGTRMPRIDWKTLSEYEVLIPPDEKVMEFDSIVRPSIDKIFKNIEQIQTLEYLRDTLLPKLMSGEIRVQH